ncbi:MAG: class I SAM-dependent methyltransferase [Bacteroidota bacterium]
MSTPRQTSDPSFWDARYAGPAFAFGRAPNAVVAAEADRLGDGARVLDLGAGEGRNAVFLARRGHDVTALDVATAELDRATAWAAAEGLRLGVEEADLSGWSAPEAAYDGVVCTFVHLLSHERPAMWAAIERALRPGGVLLGEWFTPDHLRLGGPGPSRPDRLVSAGEVRDALRGGRLHVCREVERGLDEGPFLQGRAATVQVVFERAG